MTLEEKKIKKVKNVVKKVSPETKVEVLNTPPKVEIQPFDMDRTYSKYYTKVMKGIKNLQGKVVMMSPDKFLEELKIKVKANPMEVQYLKEGRAMALFPIPVIDYINGHVLGGERVLVCKEAGIKKVPVLVCDSVLNNPRIAQDD